jgi:hypothetical protein
VAAPPGSTADINPTVVPPGSAADITATVAPPGSAVDRNAATRGAGHRYAVQAGHFHTLDPSGRSDPPPSRDTYPHRLGTNVAGSDTSGHAALSGHVALLPARGTQTRPKQSASASRSTWSGPLGHLTAREPHQPLSSYAGRAPLLSARRTMDTKLISMAGPSMVGASMVGVPTAAAAAASSVQVGRGVALSAAAADQKDLRAGGPTGGDDKIPVRSDGSIVQTEVLMAGLASPPGTPTVASPGQRARIMAWASIGAARPAALSRRYPSGPPHATGAICATVPPPVGERVRVALGGAGIGTVYPPPHALLGASVPTVGEPVQLALGGAGMGSVYDAGSGGAAAGLKRWMRAALGEEESARRARILDEEASSPWWSSPGGLRGSASQGYLVNRLLTCGALHVETGSFILLWSRASLVLLSILHLLNVILSGASSVSGDACGIGVSAIFATIGWSHWRWRAKVATREWSATIGARGAEGVLRSLRIAGALGWLAATLLYCLLLLGWTQPSLAAALRVSSSAPARALELGLGRTEFEWAFAIVMLLCGPCACCATSSCLLLSWILIRAHALEAERAVPAIAASTYAAAASVLAPRPDPPLEPRADGGDAGDGGDPLSPVPIVVQRSARGDPFWQEGDDGAAGAAGASGPESFLAGPPTSSAPPSTGPAWAAPILAATSPATRPDSGAAASGMNANLTQESKAATIDSQGAPIGAPISPPALHSPAALSRNAGITFQASSVAAEAATPEATLDLVGGVDLAQGTGTGMGTTTNGGVQPLGMWRRPAVPFTNRMAADMSASGNIAGWNDGRARAIELVSGRGAGSPLASARARRPRSAAAADPSRVGYHRAVPFGRRRGLHTEVGGERGLAGGLAGADVRETLVGDGVLAWGAEGAAMAAFAGAVSQVWLGARMRCHRTSRELGGPYAAAFLANWLLVFGLVQRMAHHAGLSLHSDAAQSFDGYEIAQDIFIAILGGGGCCASVGAVWWVERCWVDARNILEAAPRALSTAGSSLETVHACLVLQHAALATPRFSAAALSLSPTCLALLVALALEGLVICAFATVAYNS